MRSWNSKEWKARFDAANVAKSTNGVLAEVFQNTVDLVKAGKYLSENGREECPCMNNNIEAETKFYSKELPAVQKNQNEHTHNTKVCVVAGDMLDIALDICSCYIDYPLVATLNMASRRNPGGGVYGGARAQEEQLFRRSDYFRSLYQFVDYGSQYGVSRAKECYPLDQNFGACFSREVTVFRENQDKGYALMDFPKMMNFIAVPAISNPATEVDVDGEVVLTAEMTEGTKNKIRTIFRVAAENNIKILVLGAFGCGAFHNPPAHVAKLFKEVLDEDEFRGLFHAVLFGVLDDHNSARNGVSNLDAFARVFEKVEYEKLIEWLMDDNKSSLDTTKEQICKILRATNRQNIERVIDYMEVNGFFEAPASVKHHNNFAGGLAKHSLEVYEEAMRLNVDRNLPADSVALCALLHDICKADQYVITNNGCPDKVQERIDKGHGRRSMYIVKRGCLLPLNYNEEMAIWWHMGADYEPSYREHVKEFKDSEKIELCKLIREADHNAAAKNQK